MADEALDERARELDEREAALKKAVEGVAAEKRLMAAERPDDVIPLNIGGTKTYALRSTLCQYEPSLLAAKFSGRWDESSPKDADGFFFIDQPYEIFVHLLNFLRAKAIETPDHPVNLPVDERTLRGIIDYYGMTQFCYPLRVAIHRGLISSIRIVPGVEIGVDSATFSTITLAMPEQHTLNLKRFEIVVESCERFQIGWYYPDPTHVGLYSSRPITFPAYAYTVRDYPDVPPNPSPFRKGVGEEGSTFAFDAARGGICFKGALKTPCPGVSIEPGSIVACERDGTKFKWSVDDSLVSEVDLADGLTFPWAKELLLPEQTHHYPDGYRPAISAKGQWRLKDFSFYQS